jgi:hypothetical protein
VNDFLPTIDSVKSNEEFEDLGILSVKTTTKLRPDFSSYNKGDRGDT